MWGLRMGDLLTFVNMVRTMREKQKQYFKTRDQNAMIESKNAESLVDRFIRNFDETQRLGTGLFDNEG